MAHDGNIDPAERRELEARGSVEPRSGAIRGDDGDKPHPDSWEAAKIDLASEQRIRREQAEAGEPGATADDEAFHGDVNPLTPAELTGLERREIQTTAAGLTAVREAMRYAVDEMGVKDGLHMLSKLNQTSGFDCQSCAWPDPQPHQRATLTEFCENGAMVTAEENTRRLIPPEFFQQHSVAELSRRSDYWLARQGRIAHPLVLRDGATHYAPIEWDDAFAMIARELGALESPDEAAFYTSGRTSNEAAFLWQLFARQFGTNNLPDCSNMCHESSGAALTDAIGIGKGTVTLEDVETTELLIDIGHNPGSCHPRMLSAMQRLKRNGGEIIAINPLPETGLNHFKHPQDLKHPTRALQVLVGNGTQLADLYVPVRIAGDLALLKGIAKELLEEEERRPGSVVDHAFVREYTHGYEALVEDLRAESWDVIVTESAVSRADIRRIARMVMRHERMIIAWAMGLTQQPQAVAAIQAIVNVLLLRGSIGKAGAGALPVRGHSNVQGDRTVGIWERMPEQFLERIGREFGFHPPLHHGYDTVETLKAMHAGKVKVFCGMGGNFLSAGPDTGYAAEGMRRCRLTAHVSIKLNRGHLVTGRQALILPTIGRAEEDMQASGKQFVTMENSMGIVHASTGMLSPASEHLLSEPTIIARLATATLGARSTVDWDAMIANYDRIRERIERVVPGFDDYNRRVREPGGFYLPNLARDRREFTTTTGRANFTVHQIQPVPLAPGQLLMMSMRSHDQFNTTVYGLDDRYRGIYNERRVVMMHEADIRELGLASGQVVDLTSHWSGKQRVARQFVVVAYPIPRRCAATYYPEANVLVPIDSVAERSNTPTSKFVIISVAPSTSRERWDYDRADHAQGTAPGQAATA
ncbi:MAG TPA: FdhF/YdeP family oxidoreductase [Gemmatimonadaceae bacterium]|nr:FdhF/YdeP family oxidoreductase [Gemmatimonadaceae bacterium]